MPGCSLLLLLFLALLFCIIANAYGELGICNEGQNGCHGDSRVACDLNGQDCTISAGSSIPKEISELHINGGGSIVFDEESFSALLNLSSVLVYNSSFLHVRRRSFTNPLPRNLAVTISNVKRVKFESHSFDQTKGPIASTIFINVTDVRELTLQGNALPSKPNTKILLKRIEMNELLENSFHSPKAEIEFTECEIGTVRQNAFSSNEIQIVSFINSTLGAVERSAFGSNRLVGSLRFIEVTIDIIKSGAILSAVTNFEIVNSTIRTVESEAFNMSKTITFQLIGNELKLLKWKGIVLEDWRNTSFENNTFLKVDQDAVRVRNPIETANNTTLPHFRFIGNKLYGVTEPALRLNFDLGIVTDTRDNLFSESCQPEDSSTCADSVDGTANSSKAVDLRTKTKAQLETSQSENASHERLIFALFAAVAFLALLLICPFGACRSSRGGTKVKSRCLISSICNALLNLFSRPCSSRNRNPVTYASSITCVSIHDYAPSAPQKLLPTDESIYVCEDKATQTLPEELTQELLQVLRNKLDDPQNYEEAGDVIAHLYDLVKVTECCNNNVLDDQETVYDVICDNASSATSSRQRIRRYDKSFRTLVHRGTRAPSPDKLSPQLFTGSCSTVPRTSLFEYRDRPDPLSNIYAEVLYDQPVHTRPPDIVLEAEYAEPRDSMVPVYAEVRRALPSPGSTVAERVSKGGDQPPDTRK